MVNLVVLDLLLLALFVILISFFLYKNRKNLGQEGWLMLYRTKWGIKLIDYVGKKYQKTLKILSYISIATGYVLMVGIVILIIQSVYLYFTSSILQNFKAPPVAPLIPYFPKIFGLEGFFPEFYFIDFIIAILIVATVHEFSHGIFARRYNIRIKSTGFAFLKYFPAIFGAFVEQDDKQMTKKTKFSQMSVLSAGVFANIITSILFYFILFLFFSVSFSATGVGFNSYSYSIVNVSKIDSVNGIEVNNIQNYDNLLENLEEEGLNEFSAEDKNYIASKKFLENQKENQGLIILYNDAPAIRAGIGNIILKINGEATTSLEKLESELKKYSPGDVVEIETLESSDIKKYNVELKENPNDKTRVWLGVGFLSQKQSGVIGKTISYFPSYKEPYVYYEPKNELSSFIKDLLWWIVIINLLVGFFNMLPLGILDGGRFFYLTILSITKSEKIAKKFFSIVSLLIFLLFFLLLARWIFIRIL
ncbi:MAG: site-2 protease family protein [Nanoarchaeota archaeon]|nr:site-2 protease family protein [Nanoarchaeota archaeon]